MEAPLGGRPSLGLVGPAGGTLEPQSTRFGLPHPPLGSPREDPAVLPKRYPQRGHGRRNLPVLEERIEKKGSHHQQLPKREPALLRAAHEEGRTKEGSCSKASLAKSHETQCGGLKQKNALRNLLLERNVLLAIVG